MYELALVSIGAFSGSRLMPLFAHFGLIVFVVHIGPDSEFMVPMRIAALAFKFAVACLDPVTAKLGLVVHPEIFNILEHLFA